MIDLKRKYVYVVGLILVVVVGILLYHWITYIPPFPEPDGPAPEMIGCENPVPIGDIASLKIIPYKNKLPFLHKIVYYWRVYENDLKERPIKDPQQSEIFFGVGVKPRRLLAVCSVSYTFHYSGFRLNKVITHSIIVYKIIQVGEPGPNPPPPIPPGPTPPNPPSPDPEPTFPDGKYGLSKFVYYAAKKNIADDYYREKGSFAISKSFSAVASSIAAGALRTPTEILTKTKESNQAALSYINVPQNSWDGFFVVLQEELYKHYSSGKLKSPDDFRTAFLEISVGLEKVK